MNSNQRKLTQMKNRRLIVRLAAVLFLGALLNPANAQKNTALHFPYKEKGLTERQAAAHLLSRFTYGVTSAGVDDAVKAGLENWFSAQLEGNLPDPLVQEKLKDYDALLMDNATIVKSFPKPIQVLRMAAAEGIIPADSVKKIDKDEYRRRMADFVKQKNIRQQSDLVRQLINQRIIRAIYSNNQLQEVLTGFWFNHFNVSLTKREAVLLVPVYERDAIRPHVTGKFESMLLATAKSPAMLIYLDNFSSSGSPSNTGAASKSFRPKQIGQEMKQDTSAMLIKKNQRLRKNEGLNENYARELMELHTLGVDGGYSQQDVTEAARIFSGWTIYPFAEGYSPSTKRLLERVGEDALLKQGFVKDGDFLFTMNRHDNREKKVLGKTFPSMGGYQEGVDLIHMLAEHPSTARFISKKLAAYFVSDEPPASLVDKMATVFLTSKGDIKQMLICMVNADEFWNSAAIGAKTKSPFELAISAARVLDASVDMPYQLFNRIDRMGQRIYYFQAPTGFPDRAQYWINTGALLNRMNFGLDIAQQMVRGVHCDLLKINQNHEPESAVAALETYATLLMPERDTRSVVKRLTPLLTAPALDKKIRQAASSSNDKKGMNEKQPGSNMLYDDVAPVIVEETKPFSEKAKYNMLAQVVGIILGSPEFQRR